MVSTPQPTLNTGFLTFTYREFEISCDYVDEKLMAKHGCDVFENFLSIFLRVNCPHSCPIGIRRMNPIDFIPSYFTLSACD